MCFYRLSLAFIISALMAAFSWAEASADDSAAFGPAAMMPRPSSSSQDGPGDIPPDLPPEFFELLFNELLKNADNNEATDPSFKFGPQARVDDLEGEVGQLTFSDENPYQLIALLQTLSGKPVLVQQGLPNVKINFSTQKPMPKQEAIAALESVLSMNGIAIAPLGKNFLRAIPALGAGAQAPAFLTFPANDFQATSQIYSKFFRLNYLSVTEAIPLLQPFMTPNLATLVPFEKQQTLLLTDTLVNLQRIEEILDKVDQPSAKREEVFFFSLKNSTASNVQKTLNQFLERGLKQRLQGSTFIDADDRTNKLIIITHPSNFEELNHLIQGLDADATAFTYSEAFALRHAEALKVVETIKEIIGSQKQARDAKQADLLKKKANDKTSSSGTVSEFSDNVTVVADERSNAIIAYGTRPDLQQIERLVNQMDVLLPQVRIEVIIAEVTLNDGSQRGINAFGFNYQQATTDTTTQTMNNNVFTDTNIDSANTFAAAGTNNTDLKVPGQLASAVEGGSPFLFTSSLLKGRFDLNFVFQQAQTNSNVRILSAPTIVTTHNKEASIEVGQQQPVLTATITDTAGTSANNTAVRNSIEYKDISLLLKVKPLIGPNGVIQMEIDQTIDTVLNYTTINNISQPVVGKRQAVSFVSAIDQEVIILGGLRQNKITDKKGKLFLLGDLPILGDLLFSPTKKANEVTELVIFIKPHLMPLPEAAAKKPQSAKLQTDQIIDLSSNRDELIEFISQGRFPDIPLTDFDRPLSTILPDPEPKKEPRVPTADLPAVLDLAEPLPMVPEPKKGPDSSALQATKEEDQPML